MNEFTSTRVDYGTRMDCVVVLTIPLHDLFPTRREVKRVVSHHLTTAVSEPESYVYLEGKVKHGAGPVSALNMRMSESLIPKNIRGSLDRGIISAVVY